ncbi:MAG: glycosyltransferase [Bacteroidaceae bacterium]|nr:glycosyltransferase [Bacteroidaceae bacterium]
MFLSIVVPVYNTSQYLRQCVDSLLHQGLEEDDYEILLVNDGSTDNSLAICQEYAASHTQIVVIDKPNGGVSSARNKGMEVARGEFVCFVDSDDYVLEDGYGYIKTHFDCQAYDLIRFWSAIEAKGSDRPKVIEGEETFSGTGHDYISSFGLEMFCYNSLYRLSFLRQANIEYKNYRVGEDFLFASTVLLACPRMLCTSSRIYRYVIHPNTASTTRRSEYMRKCVEDQLASFDELMGNVAGTANEGYCRFFLFSLMPSLLSRSLSARLSVDEFRQVSQRCKKYTLWPMPYYSFWTKRFRVYCHAINFLDRHPWLFPIASFIYAKFFVPFILKHIDRNYM